MLAYPLVALTLIHTLCACNAIVPVNHFLSEFGIGEKRHIVLLNLGVRQGLVDPAIQFMNGYRIGKNGGNPIATNTLAKMNKPAGITGKGVPEISLSAKILHIWIHHPCFGQGLIDVVIDAFEQQAPDHKANWHGGLPGMTVVAGKGFLKIVPLNAVSQNDQLLIGVNKVSKSGAENITLA